MNALGKRLRTLEQKDRAPLSPATRAWLGHHLTPAEQRQIASVEHDDFDTAGWSREAKTWLGVN